MKSIKLLLLCLAMFSFGFSQNFNHVYKSIFSVHNGNNWVEVKSIYPKEMYIILNGSEITINNNENSRFKTYGDARTTEYETHTCHSWKCVDKNGMNCIFMMKQFPQNIWIMSFVYLDKKEMYEYVIDND